jgi:hypothetical protein
MGAVEEQRTRADRAALGTPVTLATHLDRTYAVRPHLVLIGDAFRDLLNGVIKHLLIMTPPQVGKSTTAGEWAPFWLLALRPTARIVLGSYGDDLAKKRGLNTRRLIERYGARYGLKLDPATRAAGDWQVTTGGGMKACGVGSGLTGHPGDWLIVDDPHKNRLEADSKRIRDAVADWHSSTLRSRGSPGAPEVIILTRWNDDDLAGRLLKEEGREEDGGDWRVIHLPAFCTDPDRDPLGRPYGAPLPHPRIPAHDTDSARAHWAEKRRKSHVRDWAALYMGDPKPAEGALLTRDVLRDRRDYHPATKPLKVGVAVDPSGGGRDVAGIVGGYLGEDGRLYWTHDYSDAGPSEWWARRVCGLAAEIDADRIVIESNFGGDMAALVIRTAWQALLREYAEAHPGEANPYDRLPPRRILAHSRRGKLLRAEPVAQQVIEDRIRLGAYLPELEEEWATWQPGKESPGRIDASVHLAYSLLPIPGAAGMVSTATSVSRQAAQARPPQGRQVPRRPY